MEAYTICHVWTAKIKPGKSSEAAKWWTEKGKAANESLPGVKSVKAYAVQFGLGGNGIEVWQEIENYGAYDDWDKDLDANPKKYAAFGDMQDLFESGPARIMG